MRLRDITLFVDGTSDPAYAVDGLGIIAAWNSCAAEAFGIPPEQAIGRVCSGIICGKDSDGVICSSECLVKQAAKKHHPIRNFDVRIRAPQRERWFNVSVVFVDVANSVLPYAIHILRAVDTYKRMEMVLRDFVMNETSVSTDGDLVQISSARTLAREATLTHRELEILRLVAKSESSATISDELNISAKTVDNHLQHILRKLSAHSRLEAVLRAEHAGLLGERQD
jgi:DNA-binding CsgD family transcriptional regulator